MCVLMGLVDQVHDNVALIEIQTKDTIEFIVVDIGNTPCKIEEGTNVLVVDKRKIKCQE